MYYLQVYGFYAKVDLEQSKGISLVNLATLEPEKIEVVNFQGIDADSSPIRFRACFEIKQNFDILRFSLPQKIYQVFWSFLDL